MEHLNTLQYNMESLDYTIHFLFHNKEDYNRICEKVQSNGMFLKSTRIIPSGTVSPITRNITNNDTYQAVFKSSYKDMMALRDFIIIYNPNIIGGLERGPC